MNDGTLELHDLRPGLREMAHDVLHGLRQPQKWISPMYLYDTRGSQLFDRICELPEYYPTRTETGILHDNAGDISQAMGPDLMLVEPGSGSGEKARLLLEALESPAAFVPVEISHDHLMLSAHALNEAFPDLEVLPVCADFSRPFELPVPHHPVQRTAMFFPGSTIGNFERGDAVDLLKNFCGVVGDGGELLIGVDLRKDPDILVRAYDDAEGVTAAFNLNVLHRLNEELGADFDLDTFQHRAVWNDSESRIEMHLVSTRDQSVTVSGQRVDFTQNEYIHTESSHKFSLESFEELAGEAGFVVDRVWTDTGTLFSVQLLRCSGGT